METQKEINKRVIKVIKYIENSNYNKIIIVSHLTFICHIINKLFNLNYSPMDFKNNIYNCCICYVIYENDKYIMKSPLNTLHLDIKYD